MINPYEAPTAERSALPPVTASALSLRAMVRAMYAGAFADPLTHVGVVMLYGLLSGFAVLLCCVPSVLVGPLLAWGLAAYSLRVLDEGGGEVSDLWVWRPFALEAWIAMVVVFAVSLAFSIGSQVIQTMITMVLTVLVMTLPLDDAGPIVQQLVSLPVSFLFMWVAGVFGYVLQLVSLWCVEHRVAPWDAVAPVWVGVRANLGRSLVAPLVIWVAAIPLLLPYLLLVALAAVAAVSGTVGASLLAGSLDSALAPGAAEGLLLALGVVFAAIVVLLPLAAPAVIAAYVGYASALRQMFGPPPARS